MLLTKMFVFVCFVITDLLMSAEYHHYKDISLDVTYFDGAFDTHV